MFNSFCDLVLFMSVYAPNVLLHCFSCSCLPPPHLETNKQKMQKYLEYKVDTSLNVFFSLIDLDEFCSLLLRSHQDESASLVRVHVSLNGTLSL